MPIVCIFMGCLLRSSSTPLLPGCEGGGPSHYYLSINGSRLLSRWRVASQLVKEVEQKRQVRGRLLAFRILRDERRASPWSAASLGALHVEGVVFVVRAGLDFYHHEPVDGLRYPKPGFPAPDKAVRPGELPDGVLECFRPCTLWIGPRLFCHDGGRYANLHENARW